MYWKIYNIQTGQIIKAGFKSEEKGKIWLEERRPGREENYLVEEMDEDELAEWKLENEDEKELEIGEEAEEDDFEKNRYTYSTDDDDLGDDEEGLLSEVDTDENDE